MASNTPRKELIRINLTPTTKQKSCLICGVNKSIPKDRQKLVQNNVKTDLCMLVEEFLKIEISDEIHSDVCCRNCARRMQTVNKSVLAFQQDYSETQHKLQISHGEKVSKRMRPDNDKRSSKKALFEANIYEDYHQQASNQFKELIGILQSGSHDEILHEVLKTESIISGVTDSIFDKVGYEVKQLCSKSSGSVLRQTKSSDLQSFSFDKVVKEWEDNAPLFTRFLRTSSMNPRSSERNYVKKAEYLIPAQVSAGSKLLNIYNRNMSAVKRINDIIFLKGGMKKSAVTRMQSSGDCHSHTFIIQAADEIAKSWDEELLAWQHQNKLDLDFEQQLMNQITYIKDTIELLKGTSNDNEIKELIFEKLTLEKDLKGHRKIMDPGYYFVGDNVDMVTKVRTITYSNQHKDQHMYQMCAYQNRVSANDKDNTVPIKHANSAEFSILLPGNHEMQEMKENFAFIVAKKWCSYMPYFGPYEAVLPPYIEHEHMTDTKKITKRINMGVLKKNEAKNEDMVEICKFLHEYIPGHDTERNVNPAKVLSGGDYLTFERHKQAQMSVRDDAVPSARLAGLIPKMEEFHNQAEYLRVIWKRLYSTQSSRDIGTMFAARNLINARNVSADPSVDYHASSTMIEKFTDAYIIAGGLHHFGMDDISSEPKQNVYNGTIGDTTDMKAYLMSEAMLFVKRYTQLEISALPKYGLQSNTMKCRYCEKICKGAKRLRKHESTEHQHQDPLYNSVTADASVYHDHSGSHDDAIFSYTKLTLGLGLLRMNHNDAISYGYGHRIMLTNMFLYLLYKINNCPKYAYGMLETICQTKILLSERMAHRLIWNRVVNHRRQIDSNHPNDLDLEHCNRVFKDEAHSFRGVFTEKTISRVSRNALSSHEIVKNYDKQTASRISSGKHIQTDITDDVIMIVQQLQQQEVFQHIPGRAHLSYQNVHPNPYNGMNMEDIRDWISNSLKKFSAKHFYG